MRVCFLYKVLMFAGLVLACRDSQHLPLPANAFRAIPKGMLPSSTTSPAQSTKDDVIELDIYLTF
jgi:hypothetical protein